MVTWSAFPYDASPYRYSASALRLQWSRLHAGDAESLPDDPALLAAWAQFHAGEFRAARDAGLKCGAAGITLANKAQALHATYLERSEKRKLDLFLQIAQRADAQASAEPRNANAHYWRAYALIRCGQTVSVVKALSQGLDGKVRAALETALALAPTHADAHIALASFHAEIIDKAGKLLARTQGADAATSLRLFKQALLLNPRSAIGMTEYAAALVMLEGDKRLADADRLLADAAAIEPLDAAERLDVEAAKAELNDRDP